MTQYDLHQAFLGLHSNSGQCPLGNGVTDRRKSSSIWPHLLLGAFAIGILIGVFSLSLTQTSYVSAATEYSNEQKERRVIQSPPSLRLSDLVENRKIKDDVSWMIDFAVVGFPKCGTSFLLRYFQRQSGVSLPRKELCKMSKHRPDLVVEKVFHETPSRDVRVVRGLKCPRDLQSEFALADYKEYFNRANFIVSLRHPILWFESYFNFRMLQNKNWQKNPPKPEEFIGTCDENSPYVTAGHNFCTDRAKFHHALSRFGKTPMSSVEELDLLKHNMSVISTDRKIFLLEIGQLNENNKTLAQQLRVDLRDFLGLEEDLSPFVYKKRNSSEHYLDICEENHDRLRDVLLSNGKEVAEWIRSYFIHSTDVVVSSKDYFLKLLENWEHDPCKGLMS